MELFLGAQHYISKEICFLKTPQRGYTLNLYFFPSSHTITGPGSADGSGTIFGPQVRSNHWKQIVRRRELFVLLAYNLL